MTELFVGFLWSISPFGEAKVGIPYTLLSDANIWLTLLVCLIANILVFPIMYFFMEFLNLKFFKFRFYKKSAIFVARRAKKGAGAHIQKFGFWGLLVFVMLPIPGTGVYAGTIAAFLFGINKRDAFWANSIGITLSCLIVWSMTLISMEAME